MFFRGKYWCKNVFFSVKLQYVQEVVTQPKILNRTIYTI